MTLSSKFDPQTLPFGGFPTSPATTRNYGSTIYGYQKYTQDVKKWNEVMQNAPTPGDDEGTLAKILRQSAFVVEEANEIHDGAKEMDVQEMLDGHLDTRFVNDQIGVYLESLGIDLTKAWAEVCRSNNSKFSSDLVMMNKSVDHYCDKGIDVEIVESPIEGTFVLKRLSDGKIMKPLSFSEPDLRRFIPKHLRGKR